MKVHFSAKLPGVIIDQVFEGTADEIVTALRNHVAEKVPRIPFTKKDDKLRDGLKVDGKNDWSNQEFYKLVCEHYNKYLRPKDGIVIPIPYTAQGFINRAVVVGMAQILDEQTSR